MKSLMTCLGLVAAIILPASDSLADTLRIASFNIQFLGSFKKRDNTALAEIVAPLDMVVVQELVAPPVAGTYPDGTTYKGSPQKTENKAR